MGKFIVVILDSFGVGYMKDVSEVRPEDYGSNTALHIIERKPDIQIKNLIELGLMNAIGKDTEKFKLSQKANWGVSNLAHQGADSFLGHQEIMGTTPPIPFNMPFNEVIDTVEIQLLKKGYSVRREGKDNEPNILVINECATVGDNLETDLGQVYNVSACLDIMSFEEIKKLGKAVREVVKVSRVIAFGGEIIKLDDLLKARKVKKEKFSGIDAPESGVYNQGYQVVHLGYGINPKVQIPTILDHRNIPVVLIGKAADIIQTSSTRLYPGVSTQELFNHLLQEVKDLDEAFICLNVQETDLAGHAEDVDRYADRLEISDKNIGEVITFLDEDDILIIMADHGNDPTIGHSQHTRERVPLLIYRKGLEKIEIGERETMSDVAATAAEYFGVSTPQHGKSFLNKIKK